MRRAWLISLVLLLAAILAALMLAVRRTPSIPEPAAGPPPAPATQPTLPRQAVAVQFSDEGLAGKLASEVARVVQPGNVRAAVAQSGTARWVLLLVDGTERWYELDAGMEAESLPSLRENGFSRAPDALVRTTSIYRSIARSAMKYDAAAGDRILILVCPRADRDNLKLAWPKEGVGQ